MTQPGAQSGNHLDSPEANHPPQVRKVRVHSLLSPDHSNPGLWTEEDSIHQLVRAAQVTIFRLRTGHCQLLSHLHRLKISHECLCGTGPQTPNHILQSWPTFDALRRQTWPSPVDAHRKLWRPVETLADCGLRLTHRTEDLAWPGRQTKKKTLPKTADFALLD